MCDLMGNFMAQHSSQPIVATTDGKYATEDEYLASAFKISQIPTLCGDLVPTKDSDPSSPNNQVRTYPGMTKAFFCAGSSITLTSHFSPSNPLTGISLSSTLMTSRE